MKFFVTLFILFSGASHAEIPIKSNEVCNGHNQAESTRSCGDVGPISSYCQAYRHAYDVLDHNFSCSDLTDELGKNICSAYFARLSQGNCKGLSSTSGKICKGIEVAFLEQECIGLDPVGTVFCKGIQQANQMVGCPETP